MDEDHEETNVDHQITDIIQNQTFDTVANSILNRVENNPSNECALCEASTQHKCSICNNKICNFCSEQDPNSTNEMHRIHAKNDSRCLLLMDLNAQVVEKSLDMQVRYNPTWNHMIFQ